MFSTPHALLPTRPSQCIWGLWVSSFLSWSVPPLNTVILYVSKSLWETGRVLRWICLTFYIVNPYVSVARDWANSVLDLSYFLQIKAWVSSQQETGWVLCWFFSHCKPIHIHSKRMGEFLQHLCYLLLSKPICTHSKRLGEFFAGSVTLFTQYKPICVIASKTLANI